MTKLNLFRCLFYGLLLFSLASGVSAQDEAPPVPKDEARNRGNRPNLFRELNLSAEQMQQIRQLNENRKPSMQQAQRRVREATRNLDQAIYADLVDNAEIENRLKELQTAQAEIARLRATSELEVRKILTPGQLVKFRELRQRFAAMRENFTERRRRSPLGENKNAPNRRFNRQLRKIPGN